MHGLVFYPPLGEDTRLFVLPHPDVAELKFTASFEAIDAFDEFNRESVRAELWADLRKDGQWVGIPFDQPNDEESLAFSLPDCDKRKPPQLYAIFSVPLSSQDQSSFPYTFRLVYPSGRIRWLGDFGRDGSIVLERGDSRMSLLGDDWSTSSTGLSKLWRSRIDVHDMEVARLNKGLEWNACIIGKDKLPKLFCVGNDPLEFSVACLVPTASSQAVVLHPPLVLSISQGCSASVTSTGIRLSGKGSLLIQTHNPGLGADRLLDAILLQSSSPARLISCKSAPGQLILASPKYLNPVTAVIIPLIPSAISSNVSILQETLAPLLRSSAFAVYLPSSDDASFIPANQKSISFTVPIFGVEFLLSPSYTLSSNIEPSWDISLITPYSLSLGDNLPTPPPSPRFPDLHLSRQIHLKANYSAISRQPSIPMTHFVLYVLVGLIAYVLEAVRAGIIGGRSSGSEQKSGRGKTDQRELTVSTPTSGGSPEILVNIEGGMVSILTRRVDSRTDGVGQIRIELEGKRILPRAVKHAKDGTMVLSLNGRRTGGRLKISSFTL